MLKNIKKMLSILQIKNIVSIALKLKILVKSWRICTLQIASAFIMIVCVVVSYYSGLRRQKWIIIYAIVIVALLIYVEAINHYSALNMLVLTNIATAIKNDSNLHLFTILIEIN